MKDADRKIYAEHLDKMHALLVAWALTPIHNDPGIIRQLAKDTTGLLLKMETPKMDLSATRR